LECGLVFFTSVEQDLVEASPEVKSREPASIMQLIHKLVKDRHWKLRLLSHSIEVSKIHAKATGAILFLNQEHWISESTATALNQTLAHHIFHLALNFIFQLWWVTIRSDEDRL